MTLTVREIIEDFWFEWEDQELTTEESMTLTVREIIEDFWFELEDQEYVYKIIEQKDCQIGALKLVVQERDTEIERLKAENEGYAEIVTELMERASVKDNLIGDLVQRARETTE